MASSIRARLNRLEARLGLVRGPHHGERLPGFVLRLYQAGSELPPLTERERAASEHGAPVFWIPHNGRDTQLASPTT
ncbi:MAG: hypothetical protein U1E60_31530 [Reyranellaceae bacterium]